jgi:chemotaxis protein histidine kinase CheA
MKPHISERLRFVEVEDKGRKELIWWPSLIFSSFTEMLPSFPSRLMRARAVVDRENSRPLPNSNWVYLLGKSRLNNNKQFFTSIRPDETEIRVKDFFIALEEMENKYHNDQDWNLAKKEGVALLSQWVNSTVIEFPDSEGGTFTYFNMDNQDEIQVLNTTSSSLNNVENNSKSDKKDVPVSNSENDNTDDHYDHLTSVLSAHQEDEVEQLDDHRNKKRKHASESEIESSCMHNESKLAKKAKRKSKEEKKSSTDSRESSKVQKSASTDLEREDPVSKKSYLESMLETSDHQTETEALQNNSTEHSSSPERKSTRLESPTSPPATQTTQSQTSLSFKVTPQNKTDQTKKQRKLSSISSPHSKRKRQISQRECWKYVMQILREDHGFFRVLGSGMVDEYWVTSEHSQKSVDEKFLCANLENGKDYFIGEAGLKAYVHNRYNWIGEPGREFTPFSDKRRRRRISDSKLDKKPMTMPKRKKSSIKKISTKEKGTHRVIARTDCWKLVCKILQEDYGFFRVYGSGLITNYWVSGKYSQQDITEKYLQNHLQENKDYFIGDEGLKGFAHSEHKWIGELGREFSPISHKRTRRRIQDTEVEKEKSPVKSEKASKVDKGHRSTTKKSAKKSAKKPRSKISVGSSRSPEDSTGSKWSGSNYSNESKRTSVKKNPSISSSNSQKFPPNEVSFCSKSTRTRTVEERLEDCLKRLNMSYIAKDSLFDGSGSNSSFSEKKESIVKFLEMSMSGESNKASLMHVCGNPGLGKVSTLLYRNFD